MRILLKTLLFILLIQNINAFSPVVDVKVAIADAADAAAVMIAYGKYADTITQNVQDLQSSAKLLDAINNSQSLVNNLCAGCTPATRDSLLNTIDNLNSSMCQNFANYIGASGDTVKNIKQLSQMLTSTACMATGAIPGAGKALTACGIALQQSAVMAAQQANIIASTAQAAAGAERNKKEAEDKLGRLTECQMIGGTNCDTK